ncbi:MotA/TolQ/ExbB proton channel family protein [Photobacterium profundum]|uniref:Putative biopolymer transport protein ExbB-related protein n=1 Tax=Photobacterium profundum 3TCK TaxID=314280 RepID=Q1YYK5_9GAMM|nr:MotA/TolQ/ExbB proton channel family protein [Photobacterium profundum]EAS41317.1 putative biopolymer transport protein ExbB-related protein [Photobacterium profundum 3TCK]PSV57542.1 MotA/TolQ/ExbB proton channel family protein [Photobacterium profundum]
MNMKTLVAALCLFSLPFTASATSTLVDSTQEAQRIQGAHNVQRESGFKQTEQSIRAQRDALIKQRVQLQTETDQLSQTFSKNENNLATLEEQLRLETGSLGELFGVVRQAAKDLSQELETSVTVVDRAKYAPVVDQIVDAKALPSMVQLNGLWLGMVEQIEASAQLASVSVPFINADGHQANINAYRLGSMGLIGEQGYLAWNGDRIVAKPYLKQPANGPVLSGLASISQVGIMSVVVDPSRGMMLEQLANAPELKDRLEHGGVVGKVILGLLVIGAIITLFRGSKLFIIRQQIKAQLKRPNEPGNNPLGRILKVYSLGVNKKEQPRSVEALELRLLEAIVDEQQEIEKGLSMLKLLAALAPMLGLLGTVTGMIETFQVITQFGNGDPKVMAGGISTALVTTVLGLISAMPLLLAHNILSTQADAVRNILEKQGISLVAEQAEKVGSAA